MKKLFVMLLFAAVVFPLGAMAQEVDPTADFLQLLIASIGGFKGMSTLAIVGVVIQLLIKLISLPFMGSLFLKAPGYLKLLIISGLTLVGGPITLMVVDGLDFGAALIHSATLNAFMVFANQIYLNVIAKKPEVPAPPVAG